MKTSINKRVFYSFEEEQKKKRDRLRADERAAILWEQWY